jgi:hypothetical protein
MSTPVPATVKKVDSVHKDYNANLSSWTMVRDVVEGEKAVKAKGEIYLPRPVPEDKSKEADSRYEQYKMRALFYGATARTLEGLVGQVFAKPSVTTLTPRLDMISKNIDGTGQTLEQLAKLLLARVLSYGRAGILADYPSLPKGKTVATVADLDSGFVRPKLITYSPFRIKNWRTTEIGAEAKLSLVTLEEEYSVSDDGFASDEETQYRALRLDVSDPLNPFYTVEIWRKQGGSDYYSIVEGYPIIPVDSTGKRFTEIPFKFVGWQENTPKVNSVPLVDLASLNVHHYMLSADYHESVFIVGQPTPVFTGLTKDWVKEVFPKGVVALGTRAAIPLPTGASAMLLQAAPNSMAKEAMDSVEEKMVALGAQLVQDHKVTRTATESNNDVTMSVSVLSSSANNVSEAVTWSLQMAGRFVGEEDSGKGDKISIKLNTDFALSNMTSQERQQLLAEWQAGGITDEEYRHGMTAAGIATESLEEWRASIETSQMQLGGDPNNVDPVTGLPRDPKAPKADPNTPPA